MTGVHTVPIVLHSGPQRGDIVPRAGCVTRFTLRNDQGLLFHGGGSFVGWGDWTRPCCDT